MEGDVVVVDMYDKIYKGTLWEEPYHSHLYPYEDRRRYYLGWCAMLSRWQIPISRLTIVVDPTPIREL